MAKSPFDVESKNRVDRERLDRLIFEYTGRANVESMLAFRPEKAAIVLVLTSDEPDDTVNDWFAEARLSVNRQFTGTRPAIMYVQLLGLSSFALMQIARSDSSDPSKSNQLQVAATRILDDTSRSHLHSLIIRGHSSPEFMSSGVGCVSETGPAYCFFNPAHPQHDDVRCRLFRLASNELK